MQLLTSNYHYLMKAMKVVQIPLTYPLHQKDSTYSPYFQHGTHFIWPSSHHTMQYTTNSNQTSVQMLILQFSRQLHAGQHSRMLRKFRRWRQRLPGGTTRWWTLDFWRNTWKNIMYSWAWPTTWIMSLPMPLCELSNALLLGQFGHFWLWGLYGHFQWWRDTRNGGSAIVIQDSGLIE